MEDIPPSSEVQNTECTNNNRCEQPCCLDIDNEWSEEVKTTQDLIKMTANHEIDICDIRNERGVELRYRDRSLVATVSKPVAERIHKTAMQSPRLVPKLFRRR